MKKKKQDYYDSGESFANMNVEGMAWHEDESNINARNSLKEANLSKKENHSIAFGAVLRFLPILVIGVVAMTLAFVIMYLWVR